MSTSTKSISLVRVAPAVAVEVEALPEDRSSEEAPRSKRVPEGIVRTWAFFRGASRTVGKVGWFSAGTILSYVTRHPLHASLNALLLLVLTVLVMTGSQIHRQAILHQISDRTIDRIIEASAFTRGFDSSAAQREGIRELVGVGAPPWIQRESIRAVLYYARQAGLSIEHQAVLLATAEIESGFNPMARAASTSACGIFQFIQRTGEIFSLSPTECMDPWQNARSGVDHYLSNYEAKVKSQVVTLTSAEQVLRTFELSYYLHHDGPNSTNPSNELKALVLTGSHFLFRVYHVLEDEAESPDKAPTFLQLFSENLVRLLDGIANWAGHNVERVAYSVQ